MCKKVVIMGHPKLKENSIANKIIVRELEQIDNLEVRNLGQLYSDFNINVEKEQKALLNASTIVFQFPFYWYSLPGIMKHWLDEVFTYGFAYGSTGNKLHGKKFIVSTTIGGPKDSYQFAGFNHFTIDELIAPLKQTSNLAGMEFQDPVISHSMVYIPNVYNVKEEVEERAKDHAKRLIISIEK